MDGFNCDWMTDTFGNGWEFHCASCVCCMELRQDRLYEVLNIHGSSFDRYYKNIFTSYLKLRDYLSYFKLEKLIYIDENTCVAKYLLVNDDKEIAKIKKIFRDNIKDSEEFFKDLKKRGKNA